jgi:hypothetical protein
MAHNVHMRKNIKIYTGLIRKSFMFILHLIIWRILFRGQSLNNYTFFLFFSYEKASIYNTQNDIDI